MLIKNSNFPSPKLIKQSPGGKWHHLILSSLHNSKHATTLHVSSHTASTPNARGRSQIMVFDTRQLKLLGKTTAPSSATLSLLPTRRPATNDKDDDGAVKQQQQKKSTEIESRLPGWWAFPSSSSSWLDEFFTVSRFARKRTQLDPADGNLIWSR